MPIDLLSILRELPLVREQEAVAEAHALEERREQVAALVALEKRGAEEAARLHATRRKAVEKQVAAQKHLDTADGELRSCAVAVASASHAHEGERRRLEARLLATAPAAIAVAQTRLREQLDAARRSLRPVVEGSGFNVEGRLLPPLRSDGPSQRAFIAGLVKAVEAIGALALTAPSEEAALAAIAEIEATIPDPSVLVEI